MTIPFPQVRIIRPDVVLALVVFAVVCLLGALVVRQAYELRDVTAERAQLQSVVSRVQDMCVRHPDGSAECEAGTWPVSK